MKTKKNQKNNPLSPLELSMLDKLVVQKRRNKQTMRIVVYLGKSRPRGRVDYGLKLIEQLERDGHYIAGLMVEQDDPIIMYPGVKVKKHIIMPKELCTYLSVIKKNIYENPSFCNKFSEICKKIQNCQADIGVVFFGYWVPPEIYTIPKNGFINYHPGPLPWLRGMEPDTFAILENWKRIWGSVHKVVAGFDAGSIIARTKKAKIELYDTPVSVLNTLTASGIDTICNVISSFSRKGNFSSVKLPQLGSLATLKKAYDYSFINWQNDTNDMLRRRLLAFCGQDIGIRLKAGFNDLHYVVYNLELHKGKFKGVPGDILGYYICRGKYLLQPIVRTTEGVCVVLLGDKILPERKIPEGHVHSDWIIPPRKQKMVTHRRWIKKSIEVFNKYSN
ncbi:MAG TPA: formyltransferase family protein [Spirochaetota bacterium]|nr:formyltransferase family protein [Spirochaetota bacterium]